MHLLDVDIHTHIHTYFSSKLLYKTVSTIWFGIYDQSTDFNNFTKRAIVKNPHPIEINRTKVLLCSQLIQCTSMLETKKYNNE